MSALAVMEEGSADGVQIELDDLIDGLLRRSEGDGTSLREGSDPQLSLAFADHLPAAEVGRPPVLSAHSSMDMSEPDCESAATVFACWGAEVKGTDCECTPGFVSGKAHFKVRRARRRRIAARRPPHCNPLTPGRIRPPPTEQVLLGVPRRHHGAGEPRARADAGAAPALLEYSARRLLEACARRDRRRTGPHWQQYDHV